LLDNSSLILLSIALFILTSLEMWPNSLLKILIYILFSPWVIVCLLLFLDTLALCYMLSPPIWKIYSHSDTAFLISMIAILFAIYLCSSDTKNLNIQFFMMGILLSDLVFYGKALLSYSCKAKGCSDLFFAFLDNILSNLFRLSKCFTKF